MYYVPAGKFKIYECEMVKTSTFFTQIKITKRLYDVQLFPVSPQVFNTEEICGCSKDDLFVTYGEAKRAVERNRQNRIKRYCLDIETLDDLILFPLLFPLVGENANEEAKEAYLIRMKELTGTPPLTTALDCAII